MLTYQTAAKALLGISPANPAALSSISTAFQVANKNSGARTGSTASTTRTDPFNIVTGTITNQTNIVPLLVPDGCIYVDFHHLWIGASSGQSSPVIRVFGRVADATASDAVQPWDVNTSFATPGTAGWWYPMKDLDGASYTPTLNGTGQMAFVPAAGSTWYLGQPTTFALRGARELICVIETAATLSTGQAGVVVARGYS